MDISMLLNPIPESHTHTPELSSFPKFAQLPVEIRTMIWEAAVQQLSPRIIHLSLRKLRMSKGYYSRVRSDLDIYGDEPEEKEFVIMKKRKCCVMNTAEEKAMYISLGLELHRHCTVDQWLENWNHSIIASHSYPYTYSMENEFGLATRNAESMYKPTWRYPLADRQRQDSIAPWLANKNACRYADPSVCYTRLPIGEDWWMIEFIDVKDEESEPQQINGFRSGYLYQSISNFRSPPSIYLDFNRDIIFINDITPLPSQREHYSQGNIGALLHTSRSELCKVRRLALAGSRVDWIETAVFLELFGNIEDLTIVSEPRTTDRSNSPVDRATLLRQRTYRRALDRPEDDIIFRSSISFDSLSPGQLKRVLRHSFLLPSCPQGRVNHNEALTGEKFMESVRSLENMNADHPTFYPVHYFSTAFAQLYNYERNPRWKMPTTMSYVLAMTASIEAELKAEI